MFKGIYFNYCLLYRLIMSKNLKIFLGISYLLILFVFLYFLFTGIQVNRLDDFSYYKELQADLDFYISTNILINLFYFLVFAIIWVALLGFGSPILIFSGIIFWSMGWNNYFSSINFNRLFSFIYYWKFFFQRFN